MSAIIDKATQLDELLHTAVQDDKENGVFRCRRDIFTNADLFELEMKHIFESNWVYLAHESQIPNNNDYYTTWIGRQPVVITRDKTGELHAVINACAHKGAMLCRRKHGNKGSFTCPFHGWTFSNTGKLLKVKDEKTTEYPVQFNTQRLARPEESRALPELSRLPVRQPQRGRDAARRLSRRDEGHHRPDRRPGAERAGSVARQFLVHLRRQLEDADGERLRRLSRQHRALELRRDDGPAQGRRHQGGGCEQLEQVGGRRVRLRPRPHPAVDQDDEPGSAAGLSISRRNQGTRGRSEGGLHRQPDAQPVPVSERVPDGSVQHADSRGASDQRGQDRSQHLLLRPEGRERSRPRHPHPPIRRLLQRLGHGHRATTSKSFAPARLAMPAPLRCGTTFRAARRCGSTVPTRTRRAWVSSRSSRASAAKTKASSCVSTNTGCT